MKHQCKGKNDLPLAPHHSVNRLWHEGWFKVSPFVLEAWAVWSYLTNCNKLRGGKGTWVWPGTSTCVNLEVVEQTSNSPHNLLPLLGKNAPLFSPSYPTHPGSITRSDLKLDCKDCIHTSLVQKIALPLLSYIQPYFLNLFCALKNNFRNKM